MFLETVTGKVVNVVEPAPDQIDIQDIAWGLSRMPRFCGMTITEVPYNVLQHSMYVAKEVENILSHPEQYEELADLVPQIKRLVSELGEPHRTVLQAAVHDGSEAYTGDIPSPVKQIPALRPEIKKVEHNLQSAIYKKFNLGEPTELQEKIIKHADKIAQRIEAHAFMQSRGNHWPNLPKVSLEKLQQFEQPIPALDSYKLFMEYFNSHYTLFQFEISNNQLQVDD